MRTSVTREFDNHLFFNCRKFDRDIIKNLIRPTISFSIGRTPEIMHRLKPTYVKEPEVPTDVKVEVKFQEWKYFRTGYLTRSSSGALFHYTEGKKETFRQLLCGSVVKYNGMLYYNQ